MRVRWIFVLGGHFMPTPKKTAEPVVPEAMCDNHPQTPAVHTTSALLHQAISLCETCLRRIGDHIKAR